MRYIAFLKNHFFPKSSFSEKVDAVPKYLLWKSSFILDIFNQNSSSEKKNVLKSKCRKELPVLKKWLLCRSFTPKKEAIVKKQLLRKSDCSERGEKSSWYEEIAAPKK